jgi:hypothetical protein
MIKYLLIFGVTFLLHSTIGKQSILLSAFSAIIFFFAFCFLDNSYKKDGKKWPAFQHSKVWSPLTRYFSAGITSQVSLDNNQQYIFCSFPHGACKDPALLPRNMLYKRIEQHTDTSTGVDEILFLNNQQSSNITFAIHQLLRAKPTT